MSVVIQNIVPKPRRRSKKTIETQSSEPTSNDIELNEAKVIEDIRQSIEKSDNLLVTKNNLFELEVPDKMEKRRRHRRIVKEEVEGKDNPNFEHDDTDIIPERKTNIEDRTEEEKPHRRRRRIPKTDETEEIEEEKPHRRRRIPKTDEAEIIEEEKPHRRRRIRKTDEAETNNNELSNPVPNNETVEGEQEPGGDTVKQHRRRRKKERPELVETTNETKEPEGIFDPLKIEDDGRVLNIMIHRTDRLKTDLNILRPMIRVHIMDINTGKVMMKQHRDRKVTSCNEDIEKVTVILPMMTQPFDFKSRRNTIPAWEESLVFNENANYLIKHPGVIYLFEVLDLKPAYSVDKAYPVQQETSGFHHVAWGFLFPIGVNGDQNTNHKVRLQLYENGPLRPTGHSYTSNVFMWWKQGIRQPYPSTLYVTVAAITLNPDVSSEFAMRSMFPNQKEGGQNGLLDSHLPAAAFNKQYDTCSLQQWMRLPTQMCHVPNISQLKLLVSAEGANVLAFSPDGNWLACGSLENMDNFPVLLYDMTKLSQSPGHTFLGHKRIVHYIAWCHKSEFLASASADGTCRVWRIKVKSLQKENNNENTLSNDTMGTDTMAESTNVFGDKRVLSHPCFVYTVAFHPRVNTILISAGYDKIIRVWDLSKNKKEILQQLDGHKGFINCVMFSLDGRALYSGDAKGEIHVWNIPAFELNNQSIYTDKWIRSDIITDSDLNGVIINHLVMHPNGKRLFVHSRDGSIRLIDLKIKTMVLKFRGVVNNEKNYRCCLSPCGSFLFSGTEDTSTNSQVLVWNAQTGDQVAMYKDLGFPGSVSSIDYHPKCHMIAFTSIGIESFILIYTYSSEQAQFEMGYQSGNSNPGSPRQLKKTLMKTGNLTKLDDITFKNRSFENDEREFASFKHEYEKTSTDRLTRILNTLNTVTEIDRSFRSANYTMDRNLYSARNTTLNDGYASGPESKGRLMRSAAKSSTLESIPMTLNITSTSKANFTFKPPPASKKKEKSNIYLGEVVALFDYQAQRSDEISFARGEVIKIVFRDGKNWLLGETRDGKQGYLPTNYVAGEDLIPENPVSPEKSPESSTPVKTSKAKVKIMEGSNDTNIDTSLTSPRNESARHRRRRAAALRETS